MASALAAGDEREVRRAIRFFAPLLWDEGLDAPVRVALDQAAVKGIPGAEAAITDVEARGPRSRVVEAIVRRLAAQMLEELERGYASSLN